VLAVCEFARRTEDHEVMNLAAAARACPTRGAHGEILA